MTLRDGGAVSFGDFVSIARAHDENVRHRAKSGEVFDGLVRGAVFAETDGVVGENENDRQLHQSGEADGRLVVIAEIEEGPAEWTQATESHPAHSSAHGVFADAVVNVAAA